MDMVAFLAEPLQYNFIQRGMLALILVGGINAVVGCFVMVRSMAFFGDALAHSILPGIALSYTASGGNIGSSLFFGGLGAGVFSAMVIAWLTRKQEIKEDSAIAIVFVTMFALGIAIISTQSSYAIDLTHILFGSINGISQQDLLIMAVMGAIVLVLIGLFYKEFLIISFDLSLAQSLKLPAEGLRLLLLILVAVTIVVSLQAVGIALMLALLITPVATARLLVKRLHHMLFLSSLLGIVSGIVGFYASYYLDIPSGACIVLVLSALFGLVFMMQSALNRLAERN
ncbi:MAG: metal ABC transporter permease [Chloroflexi bacterium]|nr:metal ABC transporter permease [Chloroflexota bacterium]MCY3583322.1 metal ABC transporter permease [Chloroflexota bacterium]MCY3716337.1 metal ABC transporter permease [Chloroflexota bacterium]MDE2649463.1 metal ABC transporter permease [Chloroflexota bacterium]MXV91971.1 metal ABC transporter permease [Chloroflexota bacterium]